MSAAFLKILKKKKKKKKKKKQVKIPEIVQKYLQTMFKASARFPIEQPKTLDGYTRHEPQILSNAKILK